MSIMAYRPAFVGSTPLLRQRASVTSILLLSPRLCPCSPRVGRLHGHVARHVTPQMRLGNKNLPPAPLQERLLAILPYVIPMLDSLTFGTYVFRKIPLLGTILLTPLYPLYTIYRGIPFLAFFVFLALFILVVRNSNISRYIRFNVYQALILDIALIIPQLFQGLGRSFPVQIVELCSTAVFYAICLAVGYAIVMIVQGQTPDEIPGVSDSVNQQLGPY